MEITINWLVVLVLLAILKRDAVARALRQVLDIKTATKDNGKKAAADNISNVDPRKKEYTSGDRVHDLVSVCMQVPGSDGTTAGLVIRHLYSQGRIKEADVWSPALEFEKFLDWVKGNSFIVNDEYLAETCRQGNPIESGFRFAIPVAESFAMVAATVSRGNIPKLKATLTTIGLDKDTIARISDLKHYANPLVCKPQKSARFAVPYTSIGDALSTLSVDPATCEMLRPPRNPCCVKGSQ